MYDYPGYSHHESDLNAFRKKELKFGKCLKVRISFMGADFYLAK